MTRQGFCFDDPQRGDTSLLRAGDPAECLEDLPQGMDLRGRGRYTNPGLQNIFIRWWILGTTYLQKQSNRHSISPMSGLRSA